MKLRTSSTWGIALAIAGGLMAGSAFAQTQLNPLDPAVNPMVGAPCQESTGVQMPWRKCDEFMNAPRNANSAQVGNQTPPTGAALQIEDQINLTIDSLYDRASGPVDLDELGYDKPGRSFVTRKRKAAQWGTVCDVSKGELTTNRKGQSCGTPGQLKLTPSFSITEGAKLEVEFIPAAGASAEDAYARGLYIRALRYFAKQILDQIKVGPNYTYESVSYGLLVPSVALNASTAGVSASTGFLAKKLMTDGMTKGMERTATQSNIRDLLFCKADWAKDGESRKENNQLKQSAVYLCAARGNIESAYVSLVVAEIVRRANEMYYYKVSRDAARIQMTYWLTDQIYLACKNPSAVPSSVTSGTAAEQAAALSALSADPAFASQVNSATSSTSACYAAQLGNKINAYGEIMFPSSGAPMGNVAATPAAPAPKQTLPVQAGVCGLLPWLLAIGLRRRRVIALLLPLALVLNGCNDSNPKISIKNPDKQFGSPCVPASATDLSCDDTSTDPGNPNQEKGITDQSSKLDETDTLNDDALALICQADPTDPLCLKQKDSVDADNVPDPRNTAGTPQTAAALAGGAGGLSGGGGGPTGITPNSVNEQALGGMSSSGPSNLTSNGRNGLLGNGANGNSGSIGSNGSGLLGNGSAIGSGSPGGGSGNSGSGGSDPNGLNGDGSFNPLASGANGSGRRSPASNSPAGGGAPTGAADIGATGSGDGKSDGKNVKQAAATADPLKGTVPTGGGGGGGAGAGGADGANGSGGFGGFGGGGTGGADAAEVHFGADGKFTTPMGSEDPTDYFTRIGTRDSLFKIVEKRYQKESLAWARAQAAGGFAAAPDFKELKKTKLTKDQLKMLTKD